MDDSTKTMMLAIGTGIAKKLLLGIGAAAASHGLIAGNQIETFVSVGMVVVGMGWSFWNDYGRAIVLSKLEVLKAQSMAQAAKLRSAGIAAPTVTEIAAQHPTLTTADVTKVADVVVKVLIAMFLLSAFLFAPPASAQTSARRLPQPIDLGQKIRDDFQQTTGVKPTGDIANDLIKALDAKLLPDLLYAKKLADATGSKVTAPCWQAWIDMINTQQKAVANADGSPIEAPDPHVVTSFERMVELRNALQPDSDFMIKCSPVASMVKQDILGFMGKVIGGGAGLATMIPGL